MADQKKLSLDEKRALLVRLHRESEERRDEKIAKLCQLGEVWIEYKRDIKRTPGMTIARSLQERPLGFSQTHGNGCERLTKVYAEYSAASAWYEQSGIAHGFQTTKSSGWEYALEVIKFHQMWSNEQLPPTNRKRSKPVASKELADVKTQVVELERDYALLKEDYFSLDKSYASIKSDYSALQEKYRSVVGEENSAGDVALSVLSNHPDAGESQIEATFSSPVNLDADDIDKDLPDEPIRSKHRTRSLPKVDTPMK